MPTSPVYRTAARLAVAFLTPAGWMPGKLGTGDRERRRAAARLRAWGEEHRRHDRPLVWFHAPSVGEGLQAEAVIRRLRRQHPDWQVAYTYFSPSAATLAARLEVDVAGYVPYDLPREMSIALGALAPAALVFSKLDVWPELAVRASARGIPVGLIAGTVSPRSGRLKRPVRHLLRPGYAALHLAGAISPDDARRIVALGVPEDRVEVTGDPRFDSVVERLDRADDGETGLATVRDPGIMVAGSTWPDDDAVVLRAFASVGARYPAARLVLVPHEPDRGALERVERSAAAQGLPAPQRLSAHSEDWRVLVVDRVGLLARLYGMGGAGYVGGGFGRAGLHSVLEPAAWEMPVVFGPRWSENRDAALLVRAGAGHPLPAGRREAADRLAELWTGWIDSERRRVEIGRRARAVIEAGLGAADRSADLVERLVRVTEGDRRPPPRADLC